MKKTDDIKTKILDFMAKNSVYVILGAVLVTVITITAVSLSAKPNDDILDVDPTLPQSSNVKPSITSPTKDPSTSQSPQKSPTITIIPTPTPSVTIPPEITPGVINPGDDDDNNSTSTSKTFSIVLPFTKKTVITSFSDTTPVYSQTLDEWACHVGLDFSCNAGDDIKSAANGIVKSITDDGVYGKTVIVSHSNGYSTLYRGLENINVNIDELITEGQLIGTVADSLPYEAHMGTHLHFELIKDGTSVNPLSFVK